MPEPIEDPLHDRHRACHLFVFFLLLSVMSTEIVSIIVIPRASDEGSLIRAANRTSCFPLLVNRPQALLPSSNRARTHTVDLHLAVRDDGLDLALLLEIRERSPGKRPVDLETVDERGYGDEAVGLDILLELV